MSIASFRGTQAFTVRSERAFRELLDPTNIRNSLPGCRDFREVGPGIYDVRLTVPLGPVESQIAVRLSIIERNPPKSFQVVASPLGQNAEFSLSVSMDLDDTALGSRVEFNGDAQVLGELARAVDPGLRETIERLIGGALRDLAFRVV